MIISAALAGLGRAELADQLGQPRCARGGKQSMQEDAGPC